MQHELQDRTLARAVRGIAYGVAGAYLGAILFFVTIGLIDSFVHPQDTNDVVDDAKPI